MVSKLIRALIKLVRVMWRGWFAEQTAARELYAKLGFTQIGTIPGGLQIKDGSYVNTCPYYIEL